MEHNWDKYFDTTSECWQKLQALYAANEHHQKKIVKGRNLHHKFLRSWSKKDKELQDDDDDNLVSLSEGDHFLAHFYIWKSANKGYRASAALAVRFMYRKSFKYITAEIAEDIAKVWESKEYAHSEETKRKQAKAHKGKYHSEETKKKLSDLNKGNTPHNKGKSGQFHHSDETKRKLSAAKKDKPSNSKGKHWKLSEETKKKISKVSKGRLKGKHWMLVDGKRVWY